VIVCGIVGYVGNREAQPILMDCLSKLEYRGYDSCGIAVSGNRVERYKDTGRVQALQQNLPVIQGTLGIGHTRWATHGPPTAINAHPHFDCSGKIAVVHNGIIENYQILKEQLIRDGHHFISETDTEVIPHLIEKYYRGDLTQAIETTLNDINGTFAIAVLAEGHTVLVVARKESPLVIGVGDGEMFIASDVPAILNYTHKVIYLEDGDIATISQDGLQVTRNQIVVDRAVHDVLWDKKSVEKSGYDHFMIKEIREQPRVVRDCLDACRLKGPDYTSWLADGPGLRDLLILACGTSYHAGLIGKYIIEELLGIPVRIEIGSEFNHRSRMILPSAAIIITQSGETADVLYPLRKLKQAQVKTLVITNVPGSTASRLADNVVYANAGPEVSVCATKSFTAQLIELYKMVLFSNMIDGNTFESFSNELRQLPAKIQRVIDNEKEIEDCAGYLANYDAAFYVGRGINFPIALEGALKLKEISYIHAEGYAAGELKHGPFALLDQKIPVLAIVAQDEVHSPMISNIKEIKARQSPIVALIDEDDETIEPLVDMVIRVPHVSNFFSPVVNAIALQLVAYHAAKLRKCPIDFPRNLAKSVTVE
jgi:glutamine---fructose-6-phosphate transaminase (isomerizing)